MNELANQTTYLPDTIEDLTQFVLVNEEKVQALKAQIRAIKKVNLAKEVYEQKLAEAQEIGQITVEAAQKMGELLLQIEKRQGQRSDITSSETRTKSEQLESIGVSKQRGNEYEQIALHPEAVKIAVQKAIENGDVVSRNQVMKEIKALKEELRREKEKQPEVKTVVKEVVPEDYREAKSKAKAYDAETRRLNQKLTDAYNEQNQLRDRISELEEKTSGHELHARVVEGSLLFVTACGTFVRDYGGYIWITDHLDELSQSELRDYENAIRNMYAWSSKFLDALNLGKEKMLNE